jgi:hypothetical protein
MMGVGNGALLSPFSKVAKSLLASSRMALPSRIAPSRLAQWRYDPCDLFLASPTAPACLVLT